MFVSAKDLRAHTKEVLDAVSRGEKVVITYRGNKCAQIVPFEAEKKSFIDDEAFGMWSDHKDTKDVNTFVKKLREGRQNDS